MADQVNLTVSLAPGLSAMAAAAAVRPSQAPPEKPSTANPPSPQAAKSAAQGPTAPAATVHEAAQAFSDFLQQTQPDLVFQVDKETNEPFFKVVDSRTKKVIRQVPSEEVLAMAHKLRELAHSMDASGVLVDKQG